LQIININVDNLQDYIAEKLNSVKG